MWRILKIGGILILISTMPPEVLEPLALVPLLPTTTHQPTAASDWAHGGRVLPLSTQEGGVVYYYTLTKLSTIARVTSFRPTGPPSTGTTTSTNTGTSKANKSSDSSGIMAGIAALLEEAKRAKETMEAAATQVYLNFLLDLIYNCSKISFTCTISIWKPTVLLFLLCTVYLHSFCI